VAAAIRTGRTTNGQQLSSYLERGRLYHIHKSKGKVFQLFMGTAVTLGPKLNFYLASFKYVLSFLMSQNWRHHT